MIQRLTNILRLIRWKNILIFLFFQTIIYLKYNDDAIQNSYIWFNLILVLFAAAGNIQNDLKDILVDKFNRKTSKIDFVQTHQAVLSIFVALLNLLGIAISFIIFFQSNRQLFLLLIIIPFVLTAYNVYFKRIALIGNILVSGAIAYVLYLTMVYFFVPIPIFNYYVLMAFLLNLLREIVKDIEDRAGDKQANYHTLPIISMFLTHLVIKTTTVYLWVISIQYFDLFLSLIQKIIVVIILLSTIYVIKLINAEKYKSASTMLKILMFLGILSIVLI